ncbi:glycoside hydrolase family 10 protein [Mariniflexile sp.]|uniref:glycoside hydrolase family 10 protein n=1 Tax=Mariniflexile sp. TaxID=1979402 RepID=UPI004048AF49
MKHLILIALIGVFYLNLGCKKENQILKESDTSAPKFPMGYNEPVKGVWLTNVASEALYTKANIEKAVLKCKDLGINTIFVVTWNKAQTMYRSAIMKNFTGVEIDPILDPENNGRDPLQELIDVAHANNIKVFAWFEFGFASSYNENGGILIKLKPEWASLTSDGSICTKNNFDWMNALDPEVQDFISSLVLEVVRNYEVDGIQGDDRLPAMPSSGGYNPKTVAWYKVEHGGNPPPENYKDFEWVNWRSEILNDYLKQLYEDVKAIKPDCIVSMAPSVFPWSKEEYLQDWPTWINHGYVDLLCPQVYRKDSLSYQKTLKKTMSYIIPEKRHLFFPGILIQVDDQRPSKELFNFMLKTNREEGVNGEVYFFYEGLSAFENDIKTFYRPTKN